MKPLSAALSILLTFAVFSAPALAQQPRPGMMAPSDSMSRPMMGQMQGDRMQGGMMQMMQGMRSQMMQHPMHRSSMMTFMLPALADTLGLSEDQRSQLQQRKNDVLEQQRQLQQEMSNERTEFRTLFEEGEQPSSDSVREHLTTMAEMQVSARAMMYEAAQEMREILTEEQRQMLDEMPAEQQMRHMMATMPMTEMMQMMQTMRGTMGQQGMRNMRMAHPGPGQGNRPGRGQNR